jgi:hypothetical protein
MCNSLPEQNASLTDDETLVSLARTLRLIILIQDLTLTNKTLRASWQERQMQILTMVRDLAAGQLGMLLSCFKPPILISADDMAGSTPRSTCRELVLSIVQDLPTSLITEDTLPKVVFLQSAHQTYFDEFLPRCAICWRTRLSTCKR